MSKNEWNDSQASIEYKPVANNKQEETSRND